MSKFIQAKDILKMKNFSQTNFDTDGFLSDVADFFIKHDVGDELLVRTERFVSKCWDDESFIQTAKEFDEDVITEEDRRRGYKYVPDKIPFEKTHFFGGPQPYDRFDDYFEYMSRGLCVPHLVVDEPYVKNAVFALSVLAGYVVKKTRVKKETIYEVTLV